MSASVNAELVRNRLRVSWGAATDVGNVRQVNEDCFLTKPGLWLVADGMGGHAAGDIASAIIVDTGDELAPEPPLKLDDVSTFVREANQRVRRYASENHQEGMGSTLVGVALVDNGGEDALLAFNVGDSRCYELTIDDEMVQVTHDHSRVQQLIDLGRIDEEAARTHPERSVVTRALGVSEQVLADFVVLEHGRTQRVLLCSDGVPVELDDYSIREILMSQATAAAAAKALVDKALSRKGRDNATAVVVDVEWVATPDKVNGDDNVDTGPPVRMLLDTTSEGTEELIDSIPGMDVNSGEGLERGEDGVSRSRSEGVPE